jgi:hypothetical protein
MLRVHAEVGEDLALHILRVAVDHVLLAEDGEIDLGACSAG